MKMNSITEICGLKCRYSATVNPRRVAYILYPLDTLAGWIDLAAAKYDITLVSITGMDWQNVFSPWPAKGVPAGTEDFKGESPEFLRLLETEVIPRLDEVLSPDEKMDRTLVGVSMSGLFTLWQWPLSGLFRNIISLSGSFWYEGFMEWFKHQDFSGKDGFAFFLLGLQEPKSNVEAFNVVGQCTEAIVGDLSAQGVDVEFQWVPGNHFQYAMERLDIALTALTRHLPPIL